MIDIPAILAQLQQHYDEAVRTLRDDVIAFGRDGHLAELRRAYRRQRDQQRPLTHIGGIEPT